MAPSVSNEQLDEAIRGEDVKVGREGGWQREIRPWMGL